MSVSRRSPPLVLKKGMTIKLPKGTKLYSKELLASTFNNGLEVVREESRLPQAIGEDSLTKRIDFFLRHAEMVERKKLEENEVEFEVRIGVSGQKTGTNDLFWINAYNYCRKHPNVKRKCYSFLTDERIGDENGKRHVKQAPVFRRRTYLGQPSVWQSKKNISTEDISDYWVRLSLNVESLTHPPTELRENFDIKLTTRWISRHTFFIGNARVDFSKVEHNGRLTNEIEVEYIKGLGTVDNFSTICRDIVSSMFDTPIPFTFGQLRDISEYVNTILNPKADRILPYLDRSLFSEARNLGVENLNFYSMFRNPRSKEEEGKLLPDREWYLSLKVDGERVFVIISIFGTWLLFPPYQARFVCLTDAHTNVPLTVLDCERDGNNLYYIHALLIEGKEMRNLYLGKNRNDTIEWWDNPNRRNYFPKDVNLFFKTADPANSKDFFSKAEQYVEACHKPCLVADGNKKAMFENDGIILTPADKTYFEMAEDRTLILKWKPIITIDLLIKLDEDNNVKLYSANSSKDHSGNITRFDELFTGTKSNPFNGRIDMNGQPFNHMSVMEFYWDRETEKLIAKNNRYEKSGANRKEVAEDNWQRMTQSSKILDEPTLLGKTNILMKKYHNALKKRLYKEVTFSKRSVTLLEIGAGVGADINKWVDDTKKQARFEWIVAVEPDSDNITELKKRLLAYDALKGRVFILQAKGQEIKKIASFIREKTGEKQVDVIAMMDSLTFFFDPERKELGKLANTVKKCLRPGGSFIWKMLDGNRLREAFRPLENKVLKFGNDTDFEQLDNNRVKVSIRPWIENQSEYITDVDDMRTTLELIGIEKQANDEILLSNDYSQLSRLYSYGHFRLSGGIDSVTKEIALTYNATVPLSGPFFPKESSLAALENVFTVAPRNILTQRYVSLAESESAQHASPPYGPKYCYIEDTFQGKGVERFLASNDLKNVFSDNIDNELTCIVADMLGVEVYIVNEDNKLLLTNARERRELQSIVIAKDDNGRCTAKTFGKEVLLPGDSKYLSKYKRLPSLIVPELYSLVSIVITSDDSIKLDLRGNVYERILCLPQTKDKPLFAKPAKYLDLLAKVLCQKGFKKMTEEAEANFTRIYRKENLAKAVKYVNGMIGYYADLL